MDQRLELLVLPVSDVDRSITFYRDGMGWSVDVDTVPAPGMRVVQTTPPGSPCSVTFGDGLTDRPPGSYAGMHLVVTDIVAARDDLRDRGVEVTPIRHMGAEGWAGGPHPDRADYGSFADLQDPDGNAWVLQERGHDPAR